MKIEVICGQNNKNKWLLHFIIQNNAGKHKVLDSNVAISHRWAYSQTFFD